MRGARGIFYGAPPVCYYLLIVSYVISKRFSFSAAHRLEHLPSYHKCHRYHGHNYELVVELSADGLDERGFVLDYAELSFVKDYLDGYLDHRDLNVVFGSGYATTAENLSRHFAEYVSDRLPSRITVTAHLSETPKTWATYRLPGRTTL